MSGPRSQLPRKRRILVIDDDPDIRALLSAVLTFAGYSVTTAENGQEALKLIGKRPADLILLDFQMPIMDGRRFAQVLGERGSPTPIVLITADPDAQVIAEEINAEAYFPKPFQVANLLTLVNALSGVSRTADEL